MPCWFKAVLSQGLDFDMNLKGKVHGAGDRFARGVLRG